MNKLELIQAVREKVESSMQEAAYRTFKFNKWMSGFRIFTIDIPDSVL